MLSPSAPDRKHFLFGRHNSSNSLCSHEWVRLHSCLLQLDWPCQKTNTKISCISNELINCMSGQVTWRPWQKWMGCSLWCQPVIKWASGLAGLGMGMWRGKAQWVTGKGGFHLEGNRLLLISWHADPHRVSARQSSWWTPGLSSYSLPHGLT